MTTGLVLTIFVGAYVLIATERVHRVAAALCGAGLVAAIGVLDSDDIFYSHSTGIDWNVLGLLLGMMIIVGVLKQTGVFEAAAIWAVQRASGAPFRVMALLVVLTATASALLDNVTTVLLVAPVTLVVCERLGLAAAPYLIAEALASNIGGTATLIGDPPNIIIGTRAGLSFDEFLLNLAPPVILALGAFLLWLRWQTRDQRDVDPDRVAAVLALEAGQAIRDRGLLVRCGVVLAAVLVGFTLHTVTGVEPSLVALLGAGLLVALSGATPESYLREVEWETLAFFAGLFVLVGSLVKVGVVDHLASWATQATGGNVAVAVFGVLLVSVLLSAVVDNIPYVATMTPLVAQVTADLHPAHPHVLWWALALGADFGGNATAVGASANVVVIGLARRAGQPVSFRQFLRYGVPATAVTVTTAAAWLALRYFLLQ
jgi:Na+/H+ antiporter NhaD/arsenite permease-like protein